MGELSSWLSYYLICLLLEGKFEGLDEAKGYCFWGLGERLMDCVIIRLLFERLLPIKIIELNRLTISISNS